MPTPPENKKRKRAAYSCTECSKGKAGCDRQLPCGRCVTRRVPHLCHYLVNGYQDPVESTNDIRDRLQRIEQLLHDRLPHRSERPPAHLEHDQSTHTFNQAGPSSQSILPHIDFPPTTDDTSPCQISAQLDGHPIPDPGDAHDIQAGRRSAGRDGFMIHGRYFGPSAMAHVGGRGGAVELMKALSVPDPETPQQTHGEGDRRPPRAVVDLLQDLPPKSLCDELVRRYFDEINLTRYPIRRQHFELFYETLWNSIGTYSLDAVQTRRLPLLFIILAISLLSAPQATLRIDPSLSSDQVAITRLKRANDLYLASRRAAMHCDGLANTEGDLMLVMMEALTVRYLILARRAPDALPVLGSTIKRAQSYGLHRNTRTTASLSQDDEQERRLVWSYVFHLDRYLSLLLGSPLSIDERAVDAEPPLNLSLEGIDLPADHFTPYSFLVCRDKLAKIMGDVTYQVFYSRSGPAYDVVRKLDDKLTGWAESLPTPLHLHTYGKDPLELDDDLTATQRYLLSTEFNFTRIALHRYYLTRSDPENLFELSRDRCLQAAMDDLWARTIFSFPGLANLSTGSYRVSSSITILGITLLLNPAPSIVHTIRECLSNFAAARRGNADLLDETRVKEVAVIEMLEHQAEGMATRIHSRAGSPAAHNYPLTAETSDLQPHNDMSNPSFENLFDLFWGGGGVNANAGSTIPVTSAETGPMMTNATTMGGPGLAGAGISQTLDWDQLASLFDTSGTAGAGSSM